MSCGGSGQSSTEIQDQCWNCSGIGTVSIPDKQKVIAQSKANTRNSTNSKTSNQNSSSPSKQSSDTVSETIGGISLLIAGIAGFIIYQDEPEIGPALGVTFVAFIVSGIALYVAYYAIKVVIEILKFFFILAFWSAIIIIVSNVLGFEWAVNIVDSL